MREKTMTFSFSPFKPGITLGIAMALFASCERSKELPNILWVTIEDTSPQFIGFYGNDQVKTPNMDRLAKEGVIFNNAFASGPVCSASRNTLITGVNTGQLGTGNHRSMYPLPPYIRGFPAYLRAAGYYTSNNFKTDYNTSHGKEVINASWDESSNEAGWWGRQGIQNFFSVVNFLDSHQSRTMTHPWKWYQEFILGNLDEDEITNHNEIDVPPIYRDTDEMRRNVSRVHNSLNLTDKNIGLLLDSLERHGLKESTIIFFFADHGQGIPRGKFSSVGFSYRVPFFIWFPKKFRHLSPWKLGRPTDELINFEDLPPTVLSLAGVQIPEYMTGRAFLGKQRRKTDSYVFCSRDRIDETINLVRTATDGRYFYIREFFPRYPSVMYEKYADVSDILKSIRKDYAEGKLNREQSLLMVRRDTEYLYDLKNDPWELNNLANDPDYSEKLSEMRRILYERLIENTDIHFLHEYEIRRISGYTSPYEYRKSETRKIHEIIDAAYEATDPLTAPARLFELLVSPNSHIRYWAVVGIHNNLNEETVDRDKLLSALEDDYPPVVIEGAAAAWDLFQYPDAEEIIVNYVKDKNINLSLHALQMIQYMDKVTESMLSAVKDILEKRNLSADGYNYNFDIVSCCEVILYRHKGEPLFYEGFAKWIDD